ncbi:MAG: hypothetical protein WCF68_09790 [Terriglobales bacterium]
MTWNLADWAMVTVLVGAVCVLTYVSLQRTLRRALFEQRQAFERQLDALASTLAALDKRVAELGMAQAVRPAAAPVNKTEAAPVAAELASPPRKEEEVTPEMLVVIAAAVTAFLGKKVRIRSAQMLQSPYEIVNPWSQQGRVFVQASHNLRSRG